MQLQINNTRQQIFRETLSWVSIILSGIAIVFLLINLISGMIFNSYEMAGDMPDEMIYNPKEYKISGLMIFALIVVVIFFGGFMWVAAGFLKQKTWADRFISVYLWFFTVLIPLVFLLYWAGEKGKLSKMKASLLSTPEIMQFYETANLDLNIRLIFLGIAVLFAMVLLVKVNLKIKN